MLNIINSIGINIDYQSVLELIVLTRFYSEKELRNSDVYDLYGFYYGYVCGFEYIGGELYIRICIKYSAEDTVPDIEVLKKRFSEKNIVLKHDDLEYMVIYAREHGIEIPYKVVEKEIVLLKSLIKPSEIAVIDKVSEPDKYLILLKTPREARFRGWRSEPSRPAPKPEYIKEKLVVSITNGLLGIGREIVVAPNMVGLRIERIGRGVGYIQWLRFLSDLRNKGLKDIYRKLAEYRDPLLYRRLEVTEYSRLVNDLRRIGVPDNIIETLENYIEETSGKGIYLDIPWNNILYINDIVVAQ